MNNICKTYNLSVYFIFRHSAQSNYQDELGKVYHYTDHSPNHEKVKRGVWVLCYQKETNCLLGIARVGRIRIKKRGKLRHYYAYYDSYKPFKRPLACTPALLRKAGIKLQLAGKLPGIIQLNEKQWKKLMGEIGSIFYR